MKKHLIAAAVAGALAVPAMAQVTVSGTLDVKAFNNSKTTSTAASATTTTESKQVGNANGATTGGQDGWSTSQLVFTASEDLGGGLKATAVLSHRASAPTGGVARDRYINLSGGFGAVRIGRFNSAITANYLTLSGIPTTGNAGHTYGFVAGTTTISANSAGVTSDPGDFERGDGNMLQYTTPNFGGIVATVGMRNVSTDASHVNGATSAGKAKSAQSQATVGYSAGPLALGVGYGTREVTADGTTGKNEADLMWVAGSYNLGMAKVSVSYGTREHTDTTSGTSVKDADIALTTVGVSVPMGAITLHAFMYDGEDERSVATTTGVKLKGHQLGAQYALSKRTFAYLVMGEDKSTRSGTSTEAIAKTTQTGMGISHSF